MFRLAWSRRGPYPAALFSKKSVIKNKCGSESGATISGPVRSVLWSGRCVVRELDDGGGD
jgi:hypothetical protein